MMLLILLDGTIYMKSNELITQKIAENISKSSVQQVKVRSVLTCEADIGICVKCYGINLATTTLANMEMLLVLWQLNLLVSQEHS